MFTNQGNGASPGGLKQWVQSTSMTTEDMTPDDDENPFGRRALRGQQLIEAVLSGAGYVARDIDTGEVIDSVPPRVSQETKAAAARTN